MPEAMGILAQQPWASLPMALGTRAHVRGHAYPCTWVWVSMYVGIDTHVRVQVKLISVDTFLLYQLEKVDTISYIKLEK